MNLNLTQEQLENIQTDYGLVFINYGEATQQQLGPTRGGGEFTVTAVIRDIEFDGRMGKTKGAQVIDEINAMLKCTIMDTSLAMLAKFIPGAVLDGTTIKNGVGGVIPNSSYLSNITEFAKVVGGGYKKITLFNAMSENPFTLAAKPKGEGEVALEVYGHWDPTNQSEGSLYTIEDIASIDADTTKPTAVTVPADAATSVVVSSNLTATFSEAIREGDITTDNLVLIKATDGSVVAGELTYVPATKVATFNPTADLEAATAYIWMITNVRDVAGNKIVPVAINFTTA